MLRPAADLLDKIDVFPRYAIELGAFKIPAFLVEKT